MYVHVLYMSIVVMGSCLGEIGGGREGGREGRHIDIDLYNVHACIVHV